MRERRGEGGDEKEGCTTESRQLKSAWSGKAEEGDEEEERSRWRDMVDGGEEGEGGWRENRKTVEMGVGGR